MLGLWDVKGQTQGSVHARLALYQLSYIPSCYGQFCIIHDQLTCQTQGPEWPSPCQTFPTSIACSKG